MLANMIAPPDNTLHIHTPLIGDALDASISDVKAMKLNCLQLCLRSVMPPLPDKDAVKPSFFTMMEAEKVRLKVFAWPPDYPAGQNQTTRDTINKLLGILRSDSEEYGGFGSQHDADHPDNRFFWRLAAIADQICPFEKTLADRSCHIPKVFIYATGKASNAPVDNRTQLSQELCEKYAGQLKLDPQPSPVEPYPSPDPNHT